MQMLDRNPDGEALYSQIVSHYRGRIQGGGLAPGDQLPTEIELAQQHRISRGTVRQAMNALVKEGLLERVAGRGTFVRSLAQDEVYALPSEKRLGVVLNQAGDQLNMEILIGVEQAAKSRGYQVSFVYSEENREQQDRDIARLKADRIAGYIIFPISDQENDATIAEVQSSGTPIVLVDRYLPELSTDYVGADNRAGGYRATEHLLILGHKRVGFIHFDNGTLHTTSVRDRWEGYSAALREYALAYDESLIFTVPRGKQLNAASFVSFFDQPNRPTAVFAITDHIVPALLQAARQANVRVPHDLAVVGFDDLNYAAHLNPALTTVAQPRVDIGLRAGHLLIDRIEGQTGPRKQITLPTQLVVRESCGARLRVSRVMADSAVPGDTLLP
ncbi:MAG: GntR family transcriptional regulator [Roseiflexaceae bacterium]|nr:GntR family transcriptional regulator [Roseiflexaceae bacterium]